MAGVPSHELTTREELPYILRKLELHWVILMEPLGQLLEHGRYRLDVPRWRILRALSDLYDRSACIGRKDGCDEVLFLSDTSCSTTSPPRGAHRFGGEVRGT